MARAFTLVELLVVFAILTVLISFMLPAAAGTLRAARTFRCQSSQRSIAFDFKVFADERLHGSRGEDAPLGDSLFRLETFQESQYLVDEFWAWPGQSIVRVPDTRGNDPMRCPEVRGELTLRSNSPCSQGAVDPPQRISFGFNMRLHRPEVVQPDGTINFSTPARLSSSIVDLPGIPLFWDVDGELAATLGVSPTFSAPSLDSAGPLSGDQYWFPALRHAGKSNFAFTDGSVKTSATPLTESGWRWDYQSGR